MNKFVLGSLLVAACATPWLSGCSHRQAYVIKRQEVAEPVAEPFVVTEAPPPRQPEVVVTSPGPGYVWVPGYWSWQGQWMWVRGTWVVGPHPHAVWVQGHWARHRPGYVWVGGHWK